MFPNEEAYKFFLETKDGLVEIDPKVEIVESGDIDGKDK
jgi:hypothetical protein